MDVTGWDGERGEKWASNAERLEAMLGPVDAALIEALELKVPLGLRTSAAAAAGRPWR